MIWKIRFSKVADKAIRKLDKANAEKILDAIEDISELDDPRSKGKALVGNLAGLWRYRVGDYRIICDIEDGAMIVLVVDVAHRRDVYRRRK